MKIRTKRWCYDVLLAMAALACALTAIVGVRSFWISDFLGGSADGAGLSASSYRGGLELAAWSTNRSGPEWDGFRASYDSAPASWAAGRVEPAHAKVTAQRWSALGFTLATGSTALRYPQNGCWVPFRLVVPVWFLLVMGMLITWWLCRRRRACVHAELVAASRCTKCGYDLRASPGRCPECGGRQRLSIRLLFGLIRLPPLAGVS
jgi:hypothetical protein